MSIKSRKILDFSVSIITEQYPSATAVEEVTGLGVGAIVGIA